MDQIRQGDVFLRRDDSAKPTGKPVKAKGGRIILAEGEVTGHNHTVDATCAELFGGNVLVVHEPTTLDHQEHAQINIAPGIYWVVRQRQYQHGVRRVAD